MASLREISRSMRRLNVSSQFCSRPVASIQCQRRYAGTQAESAAAAPTASPELLDMETETTASSEIATRRGTYENPKLRALKRKMNLPSARYQYHPPKYNRGPMHPIQSPVSSDPTARDFVPGPFSLPRLRQTWQSTVASDIMTLAYQHRPPGEKEREYGQRLRSWDDSSPYHKNRPLRSPRGDPVLRPIEHNITFKNIPEIVSISVASFQPSGGGDTKTMIATRAAIQAVTGVVPSITTIKKSVAGFKLVKGRKSGVVATMYGNEAYDFFDKVVNLVFPRIKDWPGIKGTTGDSSGNLSFGLRSDDMLLFPEIEINQSQYPPNLMPGMRVFVKTTADSDRHARLLFQAMGVPFYGEVRD